MIALPDREALCAALAKPLPADLHAIIADVVAQAAEAELLDLTYVVVVEDGDTEQTIAAKIGFSPLANPMDGIRYDQPGLEPYWAYLRRRSGWYELIHTVANSGFAFVLLVEATGDSELIEMCRRHGEQP